MAARDALRPWQREALDVLELVLELWNFVRYRLNDAELARAFWCGRFDKRLDELEAKNRHHTERLDAAAHLVADILERIEEAKRPAGV